MESQVLNLDQHHDGTVLEIDAIAGPAAQVQVLHVVS
jgi:hypothetical protein